MKKKLVAFAVTAAMLVTSAVPAFAEWGPNNSDSVPQDNEILVGRNAEDGKDYLKDGISQEGTAIKDGDAYSVTVDFLRTEGEFDFTINMTGNQGGEQKETLNITATDQWNNMWVESLGTSKAPGIPSAITTLTWRFDIAGDPDQKYLYLEVDNLGAKDNDTTEPYVFTIKLDKEVETVESVVFEGDGGKDVSDGSYAYIYKTAPSKVVDVQVIKSTKDGTPVLDKYGKLQFVEQPVLGETYAIYSITFDDETVISNYYRNSEGKYIWSGDIQKYVDYMWVIDNADGTNHGASASNVLTIQDDYKGKFVTLEASGNKSSGIFSKAVWGDDSSALAIMDRIAGENRYETAMKIADEMKPAGGFDYFVVATGKVNQYADALSATAFANSLDAPILLVNEGTEDAVAEYIEENAANYNAKVYVIGGTKAVSQAFVDKLYKLDVDVERLAGANRYDTNLKVLEEYAAIPDPKKVGWHGYNKMRTVVVATGTNYADALSASATEYPVLLVGDRLTKDQRAFLRDECTYTDKAGVTYYVVDNYAVVGGTKAVNGNIMNELAGKSYVADAKKVVRYGGANRYATNRSIVENLMPGYTTADYVFVATGNDYADALTGGVLAAKTECPILLVNDTHYEIAKKLVKSIKSADTDASFGGLVVVGGENAVSNELVQKIA